MRPRPGRFELVLRRRTSRSARCSPRVNAARCSCRPRPLDRRPRRAARSSDVQGHVLAAADVSRSIGSPRRGRPTASSSCRSPRADRALRARRARALASCVAAARAAAPSARALSSLRRSRPASSLRRVVVEAVGGRPGDGRAGDRRLRTDRLAVAGRCSSAARSAAASLIAAVTVAVGAAAVQWTQGAVTVAGAAARARRAGLRGRLLAARAPRTLAPARPARGLDLTPACSRCRCSRSWSVAAGGPDCPALETSEALALRLSRACGHERRLPALVHRRRPCSGSSGPACSPACCPSSAARCSAAIGAADDRPARLAAVGVVAAGITLGVSATTPRRGAVPARCPRRESPLSSLTRLDARVPGRRMSAVTWNGDGAARCARRAQRIGRLIAVGVARARRPTPLAGSWHATAKPASSTDAGRCAASQALPGSYDRVAPRA